MAWYKRINRRFFDGACPDRVCVRWASEDEEKEMKWEEIYFGWAQKVEGSRYHDYEIVMSRSLNEKWMVRMSTLVHEMVHLATNLKDDHGPAFEYWRQYVSDKGIFKKHALRKGRTLF